MAFDHVYDEHAGGEAPQRSPPSLQQVYLGHYQAERVSPGDYGVQPGRDNNRQERRAGVAQILQPFAEYVRVLRSPNQPSRKHGVQHRERPVRYQGPAVLARLRRG